MRMCVLHECFVLYNEEKCPICKEINSLIKKADKLHRELTEWEEKYQEG